METLPITYRDYTIKRGEHTKFEFVHNEYDGPGDNRLGVCDTIDECRMEIDNNFIETLARENDLLQQQVDKMNKIRDNDTESLLRASIEIEEYKKDVANRDATIAILDGFVLDFMKTFEDKFESDENAFNYEQMDGYQRAASYMARKNRTARYLIRRVLSKMNEMAA